MKIGVILNRVFRLNYNPLIEYVNEYYANHDVYIILPKEDLNDASTLKQQFYENTYTQFLASCVHMGVHPFTCQYDDLSQLCQILNIENVVMAGDIFSYHHEQYDVHHVKRALNEVNIKVEITQAHHYFIPSQSLNNEGVPYKVFTSFYKKFRHRMTQTKKHHYQWSDILPNIVNSTEKYSRLNHVDDDKSISESSYLTFWNHYVEGHLLDYKKKREQLTPIETSQLSIALSYGVVDLHVIINDLLSRYEEAPKNIESLIREIMFREFYYILMVKYPKTAHQEFQEKYRHIQWDTNNEQYQAWENGQTGYPIVDAAMFELKHTGFMHNRMRMVVSQFLTKDLFLDWRLGEDYFRKALIDYDNASNVHGWQWSSSTGTDAAPYFRMFNPIRQSERFIGDGSYIYRFLPQFDQVPVKYIHEPWKHQSYLKNNYNIVIGENYPTPIIDHKTARAHVMNEFKKY